MLLNIIMYIIECYYVLLCVIRCY